MGFTVRLGAIVVLSAFALVACSSTPDTVADPSPDVQGAVSASPVPSQSPDPGVSAVTYPDSIIAQAPSSSITVYSDSALSDSYVLDGSDVLTVADQTPLTFLVKSQTGDISEVYLPVEPNGSTGWVLNSDVTFSKTPFRIVVALSDYSLKVFDGANEVMQVDIGIGQDERPTPGGVYYVKELLKQPDPNGVYGPYAYGLSGFSETLDEFKGNDPVIGIHGTNDADSFGEDVSSGCMRMPNDQIMKLVKEVQVPLGTPVYIDEHFA